MGKIYSNGSKVKGADIHVYNRRGELYKQLSDVGPKFSVIIPLDDDYVMFVKTGGNETKVINFSTHIQGIAVEDFWGKYKMKVELQPKTNDYSSRTIHAIERVDWSTNSMSFQSNNIALLHKYRGDFEYFMKKEKFDQATKLIYKIIREFLSGYDEPDEEFTPEIVKQKVTQNKENLETLLLKRELIKAELEATALKVELLEDPSLKQSIQSNIQAVKKMISKLDVNIEKAKSDYGQTLGILSQYESIDKEVMKLKTQFNVKIEVPMVDDEESFIDQKHLARNQKKYDFVDKTGGNNMSSRSNYQGEKETSTNYESEEKEKSKREQPKLQIASSVGSEIKSNDNESNEPKTTGKVDEIIEDLTKNHKPSESYNFQLKGETITVNKYKTKDGTYEVLSDATKKIQLLKNNVLVTHDVITNKEKSYYKKLEKLNEINIRYDRISDIKKTKVNGLIYRIQVGAVLKSSPHGYRNVAEFGKLAEDFHKGKYKYLVGEFETINNLLPVQKQVREKIQGAFAVAYYYGTRITMKHAYNIISSKF